MVRAVTSRADLLSVAADAYVEGNPAAINVLTEALLCERAPLKLCSESRATTTTSLTDMVNSLFIETFMADYAAEADRLMAAAASSYGVAKIHDTTKILPDVV